MGRSGNNGRRGRDVMPVRSTEDRPMPLVPGEFDRLIDTDALRNAAQSRPNRPLQTPSEAVAQAFVGIDPYDKTQWSPTKKMLKAQAFGKQPVLDANGDPVLDTDGEPMWDVNDLSDWLFVVGGDSYITGEEMLQARLANPYGRIPRGYVDATDWSDDLIRKFRTAIDAIEGGHRLLLLEGDPGLGKDHFLYCLAEILELPVTFFEGGQGKQMVDWIGSEGFVKELDEETGEIHVVSGVKQGLLTKAAMHPGMIIIDEAIEGDLKYQQTMLNSAFGSGVGQPWQHKNLPLEEAGCPVCLENTLKASSTKGNKVCANPQCPTLLETGEAFESEAADFLEGAPKRRPDGTLVVELETNRYIAIDAASAEQIYPVDPWCVFAQTWNPTEEGRRPMDSVMSRGTKIPFKRQVVDPSANPAAYEELKKREAKRLAVMLREQFRNHPRWLEFDREWDPEDLEPLADFKLRIENLAKDDITLFPTQPSPRDFVKVGYNLCVQTADQLDVPDYVENVRVVVYERFAGNFAYDVSDTEIIEAMKEALVDVEPKLDRLIMKLHDECIQAREEIAQALAEANAA